jgi:hypothetical protein
MTKFWEIYDRITFNPSGVGISVGQDISVGCYPRLFTFNPFRVNINYTYSSTIIYLQFPSLKGLNVNNHGSQPVDLNININTTLKGLNVNFDSIN